MVVLYLDKYCRLKKEVILKRKQKYFKTEPIFLMQVFAAEERFDLFIEAGVVEVNGKHITQMGYRVKEFDVVKFNGRTLKSEKKQYLLLNKPRNYSCRLEKLRKKRFCF